MTVRRRRGPTLPILTLCIAAFCIISSAYPRPIAAQTTAETAITVTTEDTGTFAISFSGDGEGFVFFGVAGDEELGVSAIEGTSAVAVVEIEWLDDRLDDRRLPYTISLAASDLESVIPVAGGTGVHRILAENLTIAQIGDEALEPALPLDLSRAFFTSVPNPDAGEYRLRLVLRLDVPASTYPTSYSTSLIVQVTHGGVDL